MTTTTTARYEIITPAPYDTSEFAGTPAGEWMALFNKRFDTVFEAVAAIAVLTEKMNLQAYGRIAIRHVGYPEIDEFYTVAFTDESGAPLGFVEATRVSVTVTPA